MADQHLLFLSGTPNNNFVPDFVSRAMLDASGNVRREAIGEELLLLTLGLDTQATLPTY